MNGLKPQKLFRVVLIQMKEFVQKREKQLWRCLDDAKCTNGELTNRKVVQKVSCKVFPAIMGIRI